METGRRIGRGKIRKETMAENDFKILKGNVL
jgi:hypothetical protein